MKNIIISDCIFESSYIQESKLDKVEFRNCNFKQSQLSGTSLSGVDLSDSEFEGAGFRAEDLKGAIVSATQAVDFSKIFGLKVKD